MRFLSVSAIILIILGVAMLYLGYRINGLPPAITGLGFFVIAFVLFSLKEKLK